MNRVWVICGSSLHFEATGWKRIRYVTESACWLSELGKAYDGVNGNLMVVTEN